MKKHFACLLMLMILISLVGCNSQKSAVEEEPQKTETPSLEEDTLEVLLILHYNSESSASTEVIDYLKDEEILVNEWSVETRWADNGNIEETMEYAADRGVDMVVCANGEVEGSMGLFQEQYPDIEIIVLPDW